MTEHYAETLFATFLADIGVEYKRVPVASEPTPDFEITVNGRTIIAEVKQIDMNTEDRRVLAEVRARRAASTWVPNRVRGKLKDISRQLRSASRNGNPAIVVLFNNVPLFEHGNAEEVLDAMFGETTYTVAVPTNRTQRPFVARVHAGGSRSVTPKDKTSLSAVALLRRGTTRIRLSVYHNPYAIVELPEEVARRLRARQFRVQFETLNGLPRWEEIVPSITAG